MRKHLKVWGPLRSPKLDSITSYCSSTHACAPEILDLKVCSFIHRMLCPSSPAASRLSQVPLVWSWAYPHHSVLSHYTLIIDLHVPPTLILCFFIFTPSKHNRLPSSYRRHNKYLLNESMKECMTVDKANFWELAQYIEQQECIQQLEIRTYELLALC